LVLVELVVLPERREQTLGLTKQPTLLLHRPLTVFWQKLVYQHLQLLVDLAARLRLAFLLLRRLAAVRVALAVPVVLVLYRVVAVRRVQAALAALAAVGILLVVTLAVLAAVAAATMVRLAVRELQPPVVQVVLVAEHRAGRAV
jgi:hypothetical protein